MTATSDRRLRVAIIGAGIGGLAAAVLLERAGFEVKVYERDASVDTRNQGGSVAIDGDLGGAVIRSMGLAREFALIAHPEAATSQHRDSTGCVLAEQPADARSGDAEVERPELRRMLLNALPDGLVRWGHALTGLRPVEGGCELGFSSGRTATADIVVGADGAWSRVRPSLSEAVPIHSGITFLDRRFDNVAVSHPALAELIGPGTLFALDGQQGFIAQRLGDHARVYVAFRAPLSETNNRDVGAVRQDLIGLFRSWSAEFEPFLADRASSEDLRPVFELPVAHRWRSPGPITLLGDAAHLQSPFCALGSNGALLDAADLAAALTAEPLASRALANYENRMWPRAEAFASAARTTLRNAFDARGPRWYLAQRRVVSCRPPWSER
ncbi:FAD-dependent oxidoreductase [Subtercola sp. Z020]|uniref:FAD-dependent oxidoreductase n=1 Tax=Subtercola sp. Z020 TaxID=2080582 RepID=UPI000CE76749|nr:FAD-dependent monooxygenase [Subtercola sp. Z020]PPF77519.1 FAD-dependent oxidoreductase [Subtercola sp. Z020]